MNLSCFGPAASRRDDFDRRMSLPVDDWHEVVMSGARIFEPLNLGGVALANRIAVSPMCQYSAENGAANDWHLQHLGSLSLSGAGLVIVEQTAVEPVGRITHGCLCLYSDETEAALACVVAFCRQAGSAALGIQLAHA